MKAIEYIKEKAYQIFMCLGLIGIYVMTFFKCGSHYPEHTNAKVEISPDMHFITTFNTLHASNFRDFRHQKAVSRDLEDHGVHCISIKEVKEEHFYCPTCFTSEQMEQIERLIKKTNKDVN